MKERLYMYGKILATVATMWMGITSIIFWCNNPDYSGMEVFLHTLKSFFLDFN